jgi:hypothetical protein
MGGLLAGAIILVALVALLLLFVAKRRRTQRERAEERAAGMHFGTLRPADLKDGEFADWAADPMFGAISMDDPLFKAFRRVVAFDYLRWDHQLLALNTEQVLSIYHLLALQRPPQRRMKPLRSSCRSFLGSTIMGEGALEEDFEEVTSFIADAMADVLFEEALDAYVDVATGVYTEASKLGFYPVDENEYWPVVDAYETVGPAPDQHYASVQDSSRRGFHVSGQSTYESAYSAASEGAEPTYADATPTYTLQGAGTTANPTYGTLRDTGAVYGLASRGGTDTQPAAYSPENPYTLGSADTAAEPAYTRADGYAPVQESPYTLATHYDSEDSDGAAGEAHFHDESEPTYHVFKAVPGGSQTEESPYSLGASGATGTDEDTYAFATGPDSEPVYTSARRGKSFREKYDLSTDVNMHTITAADWANPDTKPGTLRARQASETSETSEIDFTLPSGSDEAAPVYSETNL